MLSRQVDDINTSLVRRKLGSGEVAKTSLR